MKLSELIVAAIQTKHGLRFNPECAFVRSLELEIERREMIPSDMLSASPPEAIAFALESTFLGDKLAVLNRLTWRGQLTVQTPIGEMVFKYDNYAEWEQAVNAASIAKLMLGSTPTTSSAPTPTTSAPSTPTPTANAPSPANVVKFTPQRLVCQFSEKLGKFWRLYGEDFYKDYGAPIYPEVLSTLVPDHEQKSPGFVLKFNGEYRAEAEVDIVDGKKKVKRVLRVWKE